MQVPDEPTWRRVGDTPQPEDLRRQAGSARRRAAALRAGAEAIQASLTEPDRPDTVDSGLMKQLIEMTTEAEEFFQTQLPRTNAQRYLASRGVDAVAQRLWGIGYAPDNWRTLTDHLRGRGYDDETIVAGGLAKWRSDRSNIVDLFRHRVVFPVRDEHGVTRGFVGRAGRGSRTDNSNVKYLNTPDGPIFHKSQILFGLAEARAALATGARPVIVEGPMDAIAVSRAAPLRYAGLALCGIGLSPHHVAALARTAPLDTGVLTALDADPAGRAGMIAAYPLLAAISRRTGYGNVDAATLPPRVDPAEILQTKGPPALVDVLDQTRPLTDLVIDDHVDRWNTNTLEGKTLALRTTAETLIDMPRHEVARQTARLAERLELPHWLVVETLADTLIHADDAPKRIARRDRDLGGGPGSSFTAPPAHPATAAARTASPAFPQTIAATTKQRVSPHSPSAPGRPAPARNPSLER
ncbi:toprim domain-containing protein [Actinomadura napierensis]|uniref:Toprim domain-containing protein n=1 Tax=Actinomadura napierensis TaxID=267854 RepID=A0ABN2ZW19_9ACTN